MATRVPKVWMMWMWDACGILSIPGALAVCVSSKLPLWRGAWTTSLGTVGSKFMFVGDSDAEYKSRWIAVHSARAYGSNMSVQQAHIICTHRLAQDFLWVGPEIKISRCSLFEGTELKPHGRQFMAFFFTGGQAS